MNEAVISTGQHCVYTITAGELAAQPPAKKLKQKHNNVFTNTHMRHILLLSSMLASHFSAKCQENLYR